MCILIAPVRITFLPQGSKFGHQVTAKGMKMENACWVKNINDCHVIFDRVCQDHIFPSRIQVGAQVTAKGMKMENVCWIKKHKTNFI